VALAWAVYATKRIPAERFTASRTGAFLHRMLANRYWIDNAYDAFGARVYGGFARAVDSLDRHAIDGTVNAMSRGTVRTAMGLRQRQTGEVQSYAWVVVLGIAALVVLLFGFSLIKRFTGG
jgi:NADH-quinone oxidoreductase subunit L